MDETRDILQRLGRGDNDAFSALYTLYSGKCAGFIKALIHDGEVAGDLTQDIFVKIWVRRKYVSKVSSFESYLLKMAKNAVLDFSKRKGVSRRFQEEAAVLSKELTGEDGDYVEHSEFIENLNRAVSELPPQRRRVFVMSRFQGLSNPQIADLTGLSIRTVETHITHALKHLRKALEIRA